MKYLVDIWQAEAYFKLQELKKRPIMIRKH